MTTSSFLKTPRRVNKKKLPKTVVVAGTVLAVLISVTAHSLFLAYRDTLALRAALRDFKDGLILQDLPHTQRALKAADSELSKIQKHTWPLNWSRVLPFFGSYKADLDRGLKAGRAGIEAGQLFINAVAPNAALLGFSVEGVPSSQLSGQERIKGVIKLMPILATQIDPIAEKISQINDNISMVNPLRYPKKIAGISVRESINQVVNLSSGLAKAAPQFRDVLTTLPEELGSEKSRTYLVLFQNDKELRSTGGFWTAYALITLNKGEITDMQSGDMYFLDIDNRVAFYPPAPAPIANYLKLDQWYIRDVNIFPDFKVSVDKMAEFWARIPGVPAYDTVVGIDTFLVEDMLKLLGPVELGGYGMFTSENVTEKLELVSNVLKKNEGDRKDILAGLMREIINRAFGLPSKDYVKLFDLIFSNLASKHVLLYFEDPAAQKLAEDFNYAGRIEDFDGDYLHINDTNLAGRKANWWMVEKVVKETDKAGLTKLTINYENSGDYNAEWNTGYRDWVRVYVPKGSKLLASSGSQNQVLTGEDYNKTFFEAYIGVDPKQKATLSFEYQLPAGLDLKDLLIQKQPGTPGFDYEVRWDGVKKNFVLDKDQEISF